jgi:hypothetical protein
VRQFGYPPELYEDAGQKYIYMYINGNSVRLATFRPSVSVVHSGIAFIVTFAKPLLAAIPLIQSRFELSQIIRLFLREL